MDRLRPAFLASLPRAPGFGGIPRSLASVVGAPALGALPILLFAGIAALPLPLRGQDPALRADRWNRAAMEWVELLRREAFGEASARVDPAVPAGAFSVEQLTTLWSQISAQLGTLQSLEPGLVATAQGYHVVDLPAGFQNQEVVLRVVLTQALEVSGFFIRPPEPPEYEAPEYVDPRAFTEVDVTVGGDPWTLPGRLSLPHGAGPFPAVVLVHGSGPNDMDETLGGNRPFRDLAWGLASRGVAVLRYDKRTRVYGGALPPEVGLREEVVEDALHALALLRGREEVDPDRVYLLGHSLGAMLAPEIAFQDQGVVGVALLAAPVRPFFETLRAQLAYLASLEEDSGSPARVQLDSLIREVDRAAAGEMEPEETILGVRRAYWSELEAVDAPATARKLGGRIFILQGGRDYQATEEDFRIWKGELADREEVTLKLYPGLNHLFAPGKGRATPTEYASEVKHVAPEVVVDLARWIVGG